MQLCVSFERHPVGPASTVADLDSGYAAIVGLCSGSGGMHGVLDGARAIGSNTAVVTGREHHALGKRHENSIMNLAKFGAD